MALTIYTLGDIPTFTAVLNGVAMLFQQGFMTGPGLGLGAAAGVGLLVTLALLLIGAPISMLKGGGGGTGNWAMLLVLVMVYSVGTRPVTIQVEDYYTGTATTVANVPFAVAVPGAIISLVTRSIANNMETAFSGVDGNYIALSSDGFASPLQLMLSMRGGKYGLPDADPYLTANIKVFVLDCVAGSSTFDPNAFAKQNIPGINNPISYITSPAVYANGLTVIYSTVNPAGIGDSCADAAVNIQNSTTNFVATGTAAPISGYLNANMNKRASPNTAVPNIYSADDISALYGNMIQGVWGSSMTAQDFMITALTSAQISDSYNCAVANSSMATYNQCTMTITQAMEQWKIDSAGSATVFTKSMVPAMNILLAMFFGFSPIMFIFAMMTGTHGLGILTKYLLFGLWSQTWLPFAVVINYIGQIMVKNEFLRLAAAAPNGLNPATVPAFYDMLSLKFGIISEMLASVPLISMALLTGSVYGLTQIASNIGKDHIDNKGAAPNVEETGSVTKVGPAMGVGSRREGNANTMASEAVGMESGLIRLGEQMSSMKSDAHQNTVSAGKMVSQGLAEAASVSGTSAQTVANMGSFAKEFSANHKEAAQISKGITDKVTDGLDYTNAEKLAIEGSASAAGVLTGSPVAMAQAASEMANGIRKGRSASITAKGEGGVFLKGGVTETENKKIAKNHEDAIALGQVTENSTTSALKGLTSQTLTNSRGWQAQKQVSETFGTTATNAEQYARTESALASSTVSQDVSFARNIPMMAKEAASNTAAQRIAMDAYNAHGDAAGEKALARYGAKNTAFATPEQKQLAMGIALLESGQHGTAPNSTREGLVAALYGDKPSEAEGAGTLTKTVAEKIAPVQAAVDGVGNLSPEKLNNLNADSAKLDAARTVNLNKDATPLAVTKGEAGLASQAGGVPGQKVNKGTPSIADFKEDYKNGNVNLSKLMSGLVEGTGGDGVTGRLAHNMGNVLTNAGVLAGAAGVATSLVATAADTLADFGSRVDKPKPSTSGTPKPGVPMSEGAKHLWGSAATIAGAATLTGAISGMIKSGVDGDNSINAIAGTLMMTPNPVAKGVGASLLAGYEAGKLLGADTAGKWIGDAVYDFTHGAGSESERAGQFNLKMKELQEKATASH